MTWFTPSFPAYRGRYHVGTVDVEIPVSELESPAPRPSSYTSRPTHFDPATVSFRIFYPCEPESHQKQVRWIPNPQREYIGAYARFLGANSAFSHLFSVIPQVLNYVNIPAYHNAEILEPDNDAWRWPVMIFSHGLGGSRNAYSHICGSLASHGMVVIAADHRDGSAPISFVHTPGQKEEVRRVEYRKVPHKASTEVYEQRDEQLRIRLWELGLIHDAVQKMDKRVALSNVADDHKRNSGLTMFAHKLNVEEPGSISWAGHSFGAATMVQFIKSTYYRGGEEEDEYYAPLFTPEEDSCLVRQITPKSPVVLLDLWTLPIQSPETAWLRKHPMPCYKSEKGGSNLLAILSEAFFKWSSNLEETKRIIAKPSTSEYPDQPGPHLFYPVASAHLSQSDFGLLFPWLTTKVFGAKEPERVLKLNTRAILQVLRNSGVELARTRRKDLESEDRFEVLDETILSKKKDSVRGWISLSTDPDLEVDTKTDKGPGDAVVEGEVLGETVTESER